MHIHDMLIKRAVLNGLPEDGVWTPVTEGEDWDRAIAEADVLMLHKHIPGEKPRDALDYAARDVVASMLVYARSRRGGTLMTAADRYLGAEPAELGREWLAISEEMSETGQLDFRESIRSGLEYTQLEAHQRASQTLYEACQLLKGEDAVGNVLRGIRKALNNPMLRYPGASYIQPWDAPDTFELQLVRRDARG